MLAREEEQLAAAFELALGESRSNVVLVEELIPGREITVNAFSVEGHITPLTVTDRLVAEPPAFGVALAHVWPSSLAPEQVGAAVDAARAAAEALGVRDGPTYTQVVVGERGAHVVELAARLGGGHDAELCAAVLGVDLNELALSAALGEPVDSERLRPETRAGGGIVRFLEPEPGRADRGCRDRGGGGGRGRRVGAHLPGARGRAGAAAARVGPRRRSARHRGDPRGGGGARWPGGRLRTLRRQQCPRPSCRLEEEKPSSVSSRPRSATRRSPPSPTRSARAG